MNHLKIKKNAIMMAMLIIFFSCNKEDAFKLFDLALSNQLVINVANIQVIYAADPGRVIPKDSIIVTKMGESQDRIYDIEGWKDLRYSNSFISIGVPPRDTPTKTNSLKFSILITHKNPAYLPQTVTMSINSNDIENKIVRLVDKNQAGIKFDNTAQTQTQSNLCTSAREMIFSTTFDQLQRKTTVTIPEGTAFKDKAGNLLCGAVEGLLLAFDPNDQTSINNPAQINPLTLFPGGLAYKAKDASWQAVNQGIFTVYDFFSLHITVGGKEAYSFSKPAEVSIDKNTMVNRAFNNPLGPLVNNDYVPIWSPNDNSIWNPKDSIVWNPETMAKVENNKVTFKIAHTGWWSISDPSCRNLFDWFERKFMQTNPTNFTPCPPCGNMKIKLVTDAHVNYKYYTEISLANNPRMIVASPMREYQNNHVWDLTEYLGGIEADTKIIFKIYKKEPWNSGEITSKEITMNCTGTEELNLRGVQFPQYAKINTNFSLTCADPSGQVTVFSPTASIFAKEIDANGREAATWDYMGTIRDGKGSTYKKLEGDRRYKFAIFPNSSYHFTTDMIKIDQKEGLVWQQNVKGIKIPIDMESHIELRFKNTDWNLDAEVLVKNVIHSEYNLKMDWIPSARTCEGYKRRL